MRTRTFRTVLPTLVLVLGPALAARSAAVGAGTPADEPVAAHRPDVGHRPDAARGARSAAEGPAFLDASGAPLFDGRLDLGVLDDDKDNPEGYDGGRGLLTVEGPTGMFLNPTSGTLSEGAFTVQACLAVLDDGMDVNIAVGGLASYGIKDWLEAGAVGLLVDPGADGAATIGAGGPFVRVRLIKDQDSYPEVSVGAIARFGNELLTRYTVFVAGSKRFPINEYGFFRSVRPHFGFRFLWQQGDVPDETGAILYVGGELEFPHDLYFVAEVSSQGGFYDEVPYAFGAQWRPSEFFGLSLAAVQTGFEDGLGLYFGIGIDF